MDRFFDPDSGIMVFLSGVADLITVNLLWLITSLPVITLGASTAALYASVRMPGEKETTASVVKRYFKAFQANLKRGTGAFLIMLVLTVLVAVDFYLLSAGLLGSATLRYVLCAIPVLLLLFVWNWIFPLTAVFDNSMIRTLMNSFFLSMSYLPTTILITVLNLAPMLLLLFYTETFFKTLMLWVLLGFALIAKVDSLLLERVFRKYIPGESTEHLIN